LLGCLVRLGGRGLVRVVLLLGHLMSTLSMITFSAGRPSLLPSTVPVWPISFRICKPEVMCPKTVYPPAESLGRVVSEKTRKNCEPMLSASLACRAMAIVPAGYLSSGGAFSIGPKVYPGPPVPVAVGSPHCSRESGSSRRHAVPWKKPSPASIKKEATACGASAPSRVMAISPWLVWTTTCHSVPRESVGDGGAG